MEHYTVRENPPLPHYVCSNHHRNPLQFPPNLQSTVAMELEEVLAEMFLVPPGLEAEEPSVLVARKVNTATHTTRHCK